MDCKIVRVEQGSDEWLALRRSRITASRLADVMAAPETKRYKKYQREKVLELLGNTNVEESPEWARHGRENEPKAIAGYEWKYGVDVEHNVFLIHKEYEWLGGSPDMLHIAGETEDDIQQQEGTDDEYDEGGEIKCRAMFKNYKAARDQAERYKGMKQSVPACDRHQLQGNMWLTGWSRWWYVNFYIGDNLEGGLTQKVHRVAYARDQKLIDLMEIRCLKFMAECYERAGL
ncbi:MAG: YqaJ viral recombinase family protein [Hyphomicrobiaceae bacterium]|nr:YqaJ viral recombinase family protein [Hyphomicrobiaceae bacterium]